MDRLLKTNKQHQRSGQRPDRKGRQRTDRTNKQKDN